MKKVLLIILILICAAVTVLSFIWPNIIVITANLAVVLFLYKKGLLREAVS